ncbi:MAG: hypothetical protein ACJ8EY_06805 [Sphingomicrobium sp.]
MASHHHIAGQHEQQSDHGGKRHEGGAADCAFAPLLAGFTLPDVPPQNPHVFAATFVESVAASHVAPFSTGPPAPPPPSRGPPTLA